jgi:hypothetical protein
MITHGLIKGTPTSPQKPIPHCDFFILGKQTCTLVPKLQHGGGKALRRLEKIWVDLSGLEDVESCSRGCYVMNIVDD